LTFDVDDNDHFPSVSRDGKHIAFTSSRSGASRVWRMDLDGGNPLELTHGKFDLKPNYASQSDWLVYSADDDGKRLLKKINALESNPVPQILSDHVADFPVISPDGQWVACAYREETGAQYKAALLPLVPDGSPARVLELLGISWPASLRWHPTGSALTYLDRQDGNTNVWRYPLEGGKPEKVTDFQSERIFSYAWSRDGRYLVCARGTSNQDVVLFERLP
jgi:Tol biopolymer transport system component